MNNLKSALRSLRSTPLSTAVVLITLALAIGANTAIFSVISGALLRPLGFGDDSRLVVVWASNDQGENLFRLSPADYRDIRDDVEAFDGQIALYRFIGSTLEASSLVKIEEPDRVGSLSVTPSLFAVLEARPHLGRLFSAADGRPGADSDQTVITYRAWQERFGADPEIVGAKLTLGGTPFTVVGVAEPGFAFPPGSDEVELYFPMVLTDQVLLDRSHRMFDSIGRLRQGTTVDGAKAELEAMSSRLAMEYADSNAGWTLTPRALREELFGDLGPTLWVLFAAVFLVLLVACANVASLLVARSTVAAREFALRAALGARPRQLLLRSLVESLVLGVLGGGAGVLLAVVGTRVLSNVMPPDIPRVEGGGLSGGVLLFAMTLSLGATLLFGVLPAVRCMRPDLLDLLKGSGAFSRAVGSGKRLREGLVVIEIAVAIVLIVSAGLALKSFSQLQAKDPGFDPEGVVSVAVQLQRSRYERDQMRPFYEQVVERVKELPGVRSAGAVSDLPMASVGLGFELEFTVVGLDTVSPTARPNGDLRLVVPGYLEAMGIELLDGRQLDAGDVTREPGAVIVNSTLVERYFGEQNPIGRTLDLEMLGELEIVGVVEDVRHGGLLGKHESEIYIPYGKIATGEMHVVVRSDLPPAATINAVRAVLSEQDATLVPSEVVVLSDQLWRSVAQPRFNAALLSGLAVCAAVLAALGIFGVVSYSVSQRTAEIGVRMAMGADATATVLMVLRQVLSIVLVGAGLGISGALLATRPLGRLLVDVAATDPMPYGLAVLAAVALGAFAAVVPAVRATRVDPVRSLRDG